MIYRPLENTTNKYINTNGSYDEVGGEYFAESDLGNSIKIESAGTERDFDIDDIEVIEDISIYFIVNISGQYYTSQRLMDDLVRAQEEENPYFILDYVTVVDISYDRIQTTIDTANPNEESAGVLVRQTLEDVVNVIRQIDWTVKPISGVDGERSWASEIGEWEVDRIPDQVFDFDNSVRITEPDPRTEEETDDEDDTDDTDNGDTDDSDGDDDTTDTDTSGGGTRTGGRSGGGGGRTGPDDRRNQPRGGGTVQTIENRFNIL